MLLYYGEANVNLFGEYLVTTWESYTNYINYYSLRINITYDACVELMNVIAILFSKEASYEFVMIKIYVSLGTVNQIVNLFSIFLMTDLKLLLVHCFEELSLNLRYC